MIKLDFNTNMKIDFEKLKEEKKAYLLKEASINDLLNKYHLNIDDINNLSLLEEYAMNNHLCDKCEGLASCRQEIKGQRLNLEYASQLYPIKEYCSYYLNYQKTKSFLKNIIYNDIPENLSMINLKNIKIDKQNKDAINLYVLLNKICDHSLDKGLYIYGNFGTGKTYMSIAFINSLALNNQKCAFVKVNDFINRMRKMVINDQSEYEYILDDLKKVQYLVLDDIGTETITSYARDDLLFNILDYRMEHHLITIFTSNHSMTSLREAFVYDKNLNKDSLKADRLMERIRVLACEQHLSGPNLRK